MSPISKSEIALRIRTAEADKDRIDTVFGHIVDEIKADGFRVTHALESRILTAIENARVVA